MPASPQRAEGVPEVGNHLSDEQQNVAEELRRLREEVRAQQAPAERAPDEVLGPARPTHPPEKPASEPLPPEPPPLQAPDVGALSSQWDVRRALPGALLGRLARRLLAPLGAAQSAFNARQAELNARLLAYVDMRFDRTHRHYDEVLGVHGRHMGDIDQRHLQLQEDLVAHVHDLVKRIDLVLGESERGRLSLEFALQDLRARLVALEQRIERK